MRTLHESLAYDTALDEGLLRPGDELDEWRHLREDGADEVLVHLHHVAGVRREPQAPCRRVRGDLQELGDAADPGDVGLDDADGVGGHEGGELVVGVDAFTGRHVQPGRRLEAGVGLEVVGVERLLDPVHRGFLQDRHDLVGRGQVPALVGVAHQGHVVAERPPDRADAAGVLAPVGAPHLDLHPGPAVVDQRGEIPDQFGVGEVEPAAVGVVRLDALLGAAEEAPQGHSGPLGGEVPEGDVDHGERHVDDSGPADPVRGQPVQALPGAQDVLRRGVQEGVGIVGEDDVGEEFGSAVHAGDPRPDQAVGGADLDHGHRPVRHGGRGVGDGPLQGHGEGVGLHGGDHGTVVAAQEVRSVRGQQPAGGAEEV